MTWPSGVRRPRPTIRDVATEAGVSIGTVSAVLNGRTNVADATRDSVLAVMERLNYAPKSAARALKSGMVSSIGFIAPDLQNTFFARVAEGVQSGIGAHDITMTLCLTWTRPEREDYFARLLKTRRLDGVVYLSGTGLSSDALIQLTETGTVIFVDEVLPGIEAPSVLSENRRGASEIARYVLDGGHRDIAVIGGPPRLWTSEQRLAGFRDAFSWAGLDSNSARYLPGDYTERTGYGAARQLFDGAPANWPTAVLCANDQMAIGVLHYCSEAGIQVPERVSVTGFDDAPGAQLLRPALTTVAQPGFEMGRAAAQLLLYSIGVRATPPDTTRFPTQLRLRETVAKIGPARGSGLSH